MSPEPANRPSPFRIEVVPFVDGTDPYSEPKFLSESSGAINHRALLREVVTLFESPTALVSYGYEQIERTGFIDIRRNFFAGEDEKSLPFVRFGLKNSSTGKDIPGCEKSEPSVDPIVVFRTLKILEDFPSLRKVPEPYPTGTGYISDGLSAFIAAHQFNKYFDLYTHEEKERHLNVRASVVSLNGRERFEEITHMLPPNLDDMIRELQFMGVLVTPDHLKLEIQQGNLPMTPLYDDVIHKHEEYIRMIVEGLEQTGGRW